MLGFISPLFSYRSREISKYW